MTNLLFIYLKENKIPSTFLQILASLNYSTVKQPIEVSDDETEPNPPNKLNKELNQTSITSFCSPQ